VTFQDAVGAASSFADAGACGTDGGGTRTTGGEAAQEVRRRRRRRRGAPVADSC
jgi:hypothetical protein